MSLAIQVSNLIKKTKGLKVLYVEDDLQLQNETLKFLNKIFSTIYIASDGVDGWEIYQKEQIDLIITDIKMPIMSGIELSKKIKKKNSKAQIIITSAYDDKDFLIEAINLGVAQFLKKPVKIETFLTILEKTVDTYLIEKRIDALQKLDNILSHERNLLILTHKRDIKICNKSFLKFFNVKDLKEFNKKHDFFKEIKLLNIENQAVDTLEYIISNLDKIFQVEIKNYQNELERFLLILNKLPYVNDEYTFLFMDITTMSGFNEPQKKQSQSQEEMIKMDNDKVFSIFENIKLKNESVRFYNLYKGLSIFHNGKIVDINKENCEIEVEVDGFQLFAFNHEHQTFINYDEFENDILAEVKTIDVENKKATLFNFSYLKSSPRLRKSPRIEVESKMMVAIEGKDFYLVGEVKDISANSISLKAKELPLKLIVDSEINARFSLNTDGHKVELNPKGIIFKISKEDNLYLITILLTPHKLIEKEILEYISHRQLNLIKEFKTKSL